MSKQEREPTLLFSDTGAEDTSQFLQNLGFDW